MLGGLQLLLVARVLDESPIRSGGRFDLVGALGLGSGAGLPAAGRLPGQRVGLGQRLG